MGRFSVLGSWFSGLDLDAGPNSRNERARHAPDNRTPENRTPRIPIPQPLHAVSASAMVDPTKPRPTDNAFLGALRGGSLEPTYGGALSFMRRRYTRDLAGVDAVVWGIPFDSSVSNRPGARFGPQAI